MSKQIWNEGRVVGYSAYETYVKQHLATNPDLDPASELEWLASTVAMGSSLLLKVPNTNSTVSEDTHSYVDITLPTNSRLGAANTIMASFFDGDGDFNEFTNWATKITNYGALVSNTSESSPQTSESEEDAKTKTPVGSLTTWEPKDSLEKKRLIDYMRIVDGVVIQPGQWDVIENKPPEKDQVQNLNTRPFVRLHIRGKISNNPRILLTGFTIRSVLAGVTSLDSSTDTRSPQDGDYLGPATYPWANRIVFSVPSSYIAYFEAGNYKRQLAKGGSRPQNVVSHTPVIDMKRNGADKQDTAIDPHQFFTTSWPLNSKLPTGYKNNSITYDVNSFSAIGDGLAVLVTYQKKQVFPPALYGSFVSSEGDNYMNPVDCVAPGAMKMFYNDDGTMMNEFEGTYPGTVAMSKDTSTGEISTLVDGKKRPVASVGIESFGGQTNLATRVKVGNKTVKSLAVSSLGANDVDPTIYPTNGANGDLTTGGTGKFNWATIANALKNNKFINVFAGVLKGGDGVSISGNGPYTITNTKPFDANSIVDNSKPNKWLNLSAKTTSAGTKITLSPNVIAGGGIKVETVDSSNKLKITNTQPYDPGGSKIVTLTLGEHYLVRYYNYYGVGDSSKSNHEVDVVASPSSYGNHCKVEDISATAKQIKMPNSSSEELNKWRRSYDIAKQHLRVQLIFSTDYIDTGKLTGGHPIGIPRHVNIDFDTGSTPPKYRLGCGRFYNQNSFKHSEVYGEGDFNNSRILAIKFNQYPYNDSDKYKNKPALIDTKQGYYCPLWILNPKDNNKYDGIAYTYTNIFDIRDMIWNLQDYTGDSGHSDLGYSNTVFTTGYYRDSKILFVATSINDGHNAQFVTANGNKYGRYKNATMPMFSAHLNISWKLDLYLKNK